MSTKTDIQGRKFHPPVDQQIRAYFRVGLFLSIVILGLQACLVAIFPSADLRVNINLVFLFITSLMAFVVIGFTALQTRRLQRRLFSSWLVLAAAMLINPLAGVVSGIQYLLQGEITYPSAADFFVLIVYPLYFLMIILLPSRSTRRLEFIQWFFDALVVMLSISLIFFNFVIGPDLMASHANRGLMLISISYLIGDLIMLWALVMILFRRYSEQASGPLWWIFGAFSLLLIYDLFTTLVDRSNAFLAYSSEKEILLGASILFIMISGLRQMLAMVSPRPTENANPGHDSWEWIRLAMPYLGWLLASWFCLPA